MLYLMVLCRLSITVGTIVPAKLLMNEIKQRIKILHNGRISIDETTYINTYTKCRFIDEEYGEWFATPNNILMGHGHAKREIERKINTSLQRYGTEYPLQNKNILSKQYNTNFERYGVINISQLIEVKAKKKQASLVKYGTENVFQSEEVKQKSRETCLDKYGVETSMQSPRVQERSRQTSIKRFGVPFPSQSEEIKAKIKESWDKLDTKRVAKKREQTNLKKYGVACSLQNNAVGLRAARKANNSCVLKHWKTGEELVCIGSYEFKTINYLNANQIEYEWQPKTFKMPTDEYGKIKTYRPDLYLIEGQLWVEIKGYFRKDAQEKWNWFCSTHQKSELWNKAKLKEFNIL